MDWAASDHSGPGGWERLLPGMVTRMRLRHLEAGETLFWQGEAVEALYRLQTGRIRLIRHLEDGVAVVVHVARPGETFAEASAFADAYHCDAVADMASEVAAVPKADFLAALRTDAEVGLGFARSLAAQVRDLRARAELRGIRSAPERVMSWLRMHAVGNPPAAIIDRTWTDIAAELSLTREATYRALAALEREGRIARTAGTVTLGAVGLAAGT